MAEFTAAELALSIQGLASMRTLFRATERSHERLESKPPFVIVWHVTKT